jgi:hypothetical protein
VVEAVFLVGVVAAIVGLTIALQHQKANRPEGSHICSACGSRSMPIRPNKGHGLIELVLWLCLFIPGLIYSIWRRSGLSNRCGSCGSGDVIPVDSPRGQKLLQEYARR